MEWESSWIWDSGEASPRNAWRCCRREFTPGDGTWNTGQLSITSDSRYVLWINGSLVGRGPVRSWPTAQMYDTYDIGHLIRWNEPNVIAVLVSHYGLSTFSYLRGRGGLLAQLDLHTSDETVLTIPTDDLWKVRTHPGFDPRSPRLSQQLGFIEHFDAKAMDDKWFLPGFDDSGWDFATSLGPVGMEPWMSVVPRDIPALSEDPMRPVRIESLHKVKPVTWTTTIDVRSQLVPGSADHANHAVHAGYLATILRASTSGKAVLGFPSGTAAVFGPCSVNGERYDLDQFYGTPPERYLDVELRIGDNWLVFEVTALDHGNGFHVGIDTDIELSLVSPIATGPQDSAFISIGPFPADPIWGSDATWKDGRMEATVVGDHARYQSASTVSSATDLEDFSDIVLPVPANIVSTVNVFGSCVWVRAREELPVPFALQQMAARNGSSVEVPRLDGGDTEVVVDFGRILSGFLEFEVEAPAGAILDFYGFEFIHEGKRQDTYRADNTLRYICRSGRQNFASPVRRGLRYLMITVRGASAPVRFNDLILHQSNFPAPEVGQFRCSDALLNDIWEISRHTTRVCMEDTFVDCPTYEQAFWVGDSRNESLVAYYAYGAETLVRRCLNLVPPSKEQTPFLCSQVPSGWTNVIPNWTFLWVLACREHFERTGDIDFVREIVPHVRDAIDRYLEQRDKDGLFSISAWNLLDWAPMDQPNEGVVTPQNCFLVTALEATADLSDLTGHTGPGLIYRQAAKELSEAINAHLWSDEQNAYIDAIHGDGRHSTIFSVPTQVIAYLCGVATSDRAAHAERHMLEPRADFVQIGSPFMSFFHYEALTRLGRVDTILEDMRKNYGAMLAYGATTCWEMYPNYSVLRANPTFLTRSHCHAWSAGPLYFLSSQVLGVRSAAPGWTMVVVEPVPAGLSWATGSVPLPSGGSIDVAWKLDQDGIMSLDISAPLDVEVAAHVPKGYRGSIRVRTTGTTG